MPYSPTSWVDNSPPDIDAANLNNIEDGISNAPYGPDASSGNVAVWNGTAWVYESLPVASIADYPSDSTKLLDGSGTWRTLVGDDIPSGISPSSLSGYPADGTKVLLGDGTWGTASTGGAVTSVFTRTGDVVAASGDYTADQVGALANTGGGLDVVSTVTDSSTSQTLDLADGNVFDVTLTGDCTFTFSGATSGSLCSMTLILRQDSTGSRTVTWPTSVTWLGTGLAPTLQTAASSVDSVVMMTTDGGTSWLGVAQTSASGLASGTSFPGSPSDGDLFYKTDDRVIYEYDSTSTNWLSINRSYYTLGPGDIADNTNSTGVSRRLPVFEDIYVERWVTNIFVNSANSGNNSTNYYTLTLTKDAAGSGSTTISSLSTNSDTVNSLTKHDISVDAVVSSSSFINMSVSVTKTGTPGTLRCPGMVVIRSVG